MGRCKNKADPLTEEDKEALSKSGALDGDNPPPDSQPHDMIPAESAIWNARQPGAYRDHDGRFEVGPSATD